MLVNMCTFVFAHVCVNVCVCMCLQEFCGKSVHVYSLTYKRQIIISYICLAMVEYEIIPCINNYTSARRRKLTIKVR